MRENPSTESDANERGAKRAPGRPWSDGEVRQVLLAPADRDVLARLGKRLKRSLDAIDVVRRIGATPYAEQSPKQRDGKFWRQVTAVASDLGELPPARPAAQAAALPPPPVVAVPELGSGGSLLVAEPEYVAAPLDTPTYVAPLVGDEAPVPDAPVALAALEAPMFAVDPAAPVAIEDTVTAPVEVPESLIAATRPGHGEIIEVDLFEAMFDATMTEPDPVFTRPAPVAAALAPAAQAAEAAATTLVTSTAVAWDAVVAALAAPRAEALALAALDAPVAVFADATPLPAPAPEPIEDEGSAEFDIGGMHPLDSGTMGMAPAQPHGLSASTSMAPNPVTVATIAQAFGAGEGDAFERALAAALAARPAQSDSADASAAADGAPAADAASDEPPISAEVPSVAGMTLIGLPEQGEAGVVDLEVMGIGLETSPNLPQAVLDRLDTPVPPAPIVVVSAVPEAAPIAEGSGPQSKSRGHRAKPVVALPTASSSPAALRRAQKDAAHAAADAVLTQVTGKPVVAPVPAPVTPPSLSNPITSAAPLPPAPEFGRLIHEDLPILELDLGLHRGESPWVVARARRDERGNIAVRRAGPIRLSNDQMNALARRVRAVALAPNRDRVPVQVEVGDPEHFLAAAADLPHDVRPIGTPRRIR
ncbi:MAG: hypothetical protein IT370_24230 [Deltaproteobacteria bacterium]|nr:hypothetical protein [Deltaproteobacteria bacterium]